MKNRKQRVEDIATALLSGCWTSMDRMDLTLEDAFLKAEEIANHSDKRTSEVPQSEPIIQAARYLEGTTAPDGETGKEMRLLAAALIRSQFTIAP